MNTGETRRDNQTEKLNARDTRRNQTEKHSARDTRRNIQTEK